MNPDDALKALCRIAGFNPDDPIQWSWWRNLNDDVRQELAGEMDKGKMPTFSDLGVHPNNIQARQRR